MTDPFWLPTWYFAMYPRRWREPETWFFHCDLWGVTRDETWVFLNPCPAGLEVNIAHKAEEVEALMAARLAKASRVYRYEAERIPRKLMPIAPLTCASVCAHVLGFRAWTPSALERKVLANGAVLIWEASDETTERTTGSQGAARAREEDRRPGAPPRSPA